MPDICFMNSTDEAMYVVLILYLYTLRCSNSYRGTVMRIQVHKHFKFYTLLEKIIVMNIA
jgi:hypothetical protein